MMPMMMPMQFSGAQTPQSSGVSEKRKNLVINAAIGTSIAATAIGLYWFFLKARASTVKEETARTAAETGLIDAATRGRAQDIARDREIERKQEGRAGASDPVQALINACRTCSEKEPDVAAAREAYGQQVTDPTVPGGCPNQHCGCYLRRYDSFKQIADAVRSTPAYKGRTCGQIATGVEIDGVAVSCGDVGAGYSLTSLDHWVGRKPWPPDCKL